MLQTKVIITAVMHFILQRVNVQTVFSKFIALQKIVFQRSSEERDRVIRKNVFESLVFQFFTNALGLLVVPLSLSYIDKEKYGIWLNASVIVTWLQNMNFGMGFGMQNKVSEAIAKGETAKARDYVSIVYRFTFLIAMALLALGAVASFFIDWNRMFNSGIAGTELMTVFSISLLCFLFYFVLGNVAPLLNALKQTSVPKLFGLLTNVLTVLFLFTIAKFSHNNLVIATIALALPTPLVYAVGNLLYFRKSLKVLQPTWKISDKANVKDVFTLGIRFFILQLTTLFISQSGVFIITQYLGPAEATPYSIIARYFYFVFFIFALVINSYWPGFTEAYFKKDYAWLRNSLKKLMGIAAIGTVAILLLLALSFILIPVWSKHSFDIYAYKGLLYSSALFTISLFVSSIISVFLNALNLLKQQIIIQVIMAIIAIGVSISLIGHYHLGSVAVNIGAIASQLIYIVVCGWQVYRFLRGLKQQKKFQW